MMFDKKILFQETHKLTIENKDSAHKESETKF